MPSCRILMVMLLAVALGADSVPAQVHARKMTLGLTAGVDRSSLSGYVPPNSDYQSSSGFVGGALFDFYVKEDVAISIQAMYLQKGADLVVKQGNVEKERTEYRTDYLSIPLAFKVTSSSRSRVYALGSIDFNFLLDGEVTRDGITATITDELKDFELGAGFGVGGLFAIGDDYLMIEGRYIQGLSNIAGEDFTEYGTSVSIKNTGFLLLVGWLFQLGGPAP